MNNSKFKIIPAKPTFGTLRSNTFQSDYITNKKSRINTIEYCCNYLSNRFLKFKTKKGLS